MKKFRRSTNKSQDKLSIRINSKDVRAIQPPKKVICATHPYQPPADHEDCLPFNAGDFFHVIDREDDANWYEVLDLNGKRGLVPRVYFEEVGKKDLRRQQPHDSGYSDERLSQRESVGGPEAAEAARKKSVSSDRGLKLNTMIYGVVIYEFNSERPDELDAKAGDHVIIIAQSNPEWFVAKPISRLGGPGLIPAAFVEVRNSATNQPVADQAKAISAAGIPKVEEWKQRAAWYKNNSVPLGTLSNTRSQDLSQGMERMSVSTARTAGIDPGERGRDSWQQQRRVSGLAQRTTLQAPEPGSSRLITPISARVVGFTQDPPDGDFYFNVQVNAVDGRAWALQRSYKEFWELQMHLMEQFPEASGKMVGKPRTLPNLPGPVPYTSENLTRQRQPHMDNYLRSVLRVSQQISNSHPMKLFFSPRGEDGETEPFGENEMDRTSQLSQQSSQREFSAQSSTTSLSERGNPYGSPPRQLSTQAQQQYPYTQKSAPQQHYRSPSGFPMPNAYQNGGPPPMLRNNSAFSNGSNGQPQPNGSASTTNPAAIVKIKVFLPSDNCILLRMPSSFQFSDLMTKVRERYLLEPERDKAQEEEDVVLEISYKDEETMKYYLIRDENDLGLARERNDKLTLRVKVA